MQFEDARLTHASVRNGSAGNRSVCKCFVLVLLTFTQQMAVLAASSEGVLLRAEIFCIQTFV